MMLLSASEINNGDLTVRCLLNKRGATLEIVFALPSLRSFKDLCALNGSVSVIKLFVC